VNGSSDDCDIDKPLSHNHPHNHDSLADSSDSGPWQQRSSGDAVGSSNGVNNNEVSLTLDHSVDSAACNGVSTHSAGDTNGASTTSASDSISTEGSFNGFIIAMHRKMVSRLFVLFDCFVCCSLFLLANFSL